MREHHSLCLVAWSICRCSLVAQKRTLAPSQCWLVGRTGSQGVGLCQSILAGKWTCSRKRQRLYRMGYWLPSKANMLTTFFNLIISFVWIMSCAKRTDRPPESCMPGHCPGVQQLSWGQTSRGEQRETQGIHTNGMTACLESRRLET